MFSKTVTFSSFSVDDLQKAKNFYGKTLEINVEEMDMGLLKLKMAGGHFIMIYPKPDHQPATYTVLNFLVTDIDKAVDELIKKGIVFEQYSGDLQTNKKGICRNEYGPALAWFRDPAGNILSVLEESK